MNQINYIIDNFLSNLFQNYYNIIELKFNLNKDYIEEFKLYLIKYKIYYKYFGINFYYNDIFNNCECEILILSNKELDEIEGLIDKFLFIKKIDSYINKLKLQ